MLFSFVTEMLFTLTTLKNFENGIWYSKEYKKSELMLMRRATASV